MVESLLYPPTHPVSEIKKPQLALRLFYFELVASVRGQTHKRRAPPYPMILFDFHPNLKTAFLRFASRFTTLDARYAR